MSRGEARRRLAVLGADERKWLAETIKEAVVSEVNAHGGNGNGNGNGNGRPWWTKTLWQVGPVVLGFCVLLGILTGIVPSPLQNVEQKIDRVLDIAQDTKATTQRNEKAAEETKRTVDEVKTAATSAAAASTDQQKLLRAICLNTAPPRSDVAREACLR